jgi:hypothetical protein
MKGLVLDAKRDPRLEYAVSDWEKETGKAVTANGVWRPRAFGSRDVPERDPHDCG